MENKSRLPRTLWIIATFWISPERSRFITHIPIRIGKILKDDVEIRFLYAGELAEEELCKYGIQPVNLLIEPGLFFHFYLVVALGKLLYKNRPHTMINMNSHFNNIILGILGRVLGVHTVARVTGNLFYKRQQSLPRKVFRVLRRVWEWCSLNSMHKIICLSEYLRENIPGSKRIQAKSYVLSPGVDVHNFCSSANLLKDIDLLFVGRMEPIKNIDFALTVFHEMLKKDNSLNFHLLGSGSLLDGFRSEHALNSCVHFHGELPHQEVAQYMQRSKFLIVCSHAEGFGNVILEAMLCKAIVVSTPISDMRHIIGGKRLGILIKEMHAAKVAELIVDFLRDQQKRFETCQRAYDYVYQQHSFEVLQASYMKILFRDHE